MDCNYNFQWSSNPNSTCNSCKKRKKCIAKFFETEDVSLFEYDLDSLKEEFRKQNPDMFDVEIFNY